MSVWRRVLIECDAIGCDEHFRSTSDYEDQAVLDAAKLGWTRNDDDDEDFCPEHGEG